MTESDQLDAAFAALANPTRRALLARLAQGEASVNALAEPFDMSLPAVSKHIRVLEQAGLVTRRRDAQYRLCSFNTHPMRIVSDWTDQYRHIWDQRFDVMAGVLQKMEKPDDE